MAIRICSTLLLLVLFAGLLSNPPDLSSCGPFLPSAAFSFWRIPEDAAGRYARGQLGILQPGLPRFYLIIAYRYLIGVGLNAEERKALFGPEPAVQTPFSYQPEGPRQVWLKKRARVAGKGAPPNINAFKTISGNDYYLTYLNCGDDAFVTAAQTLDDRSRQLGIESPAVKGWVAAQDQVFANCSEGPSIPAALDDTATPSMRADRAYQIAAANFYAGDMDAAERMFRAIADDHDSPWRQIAPYLVARSLVREATLSVKGVGADREKLAAAETQLQTILSDPAQNAEHAAARKLLDYVRVRLAPGARMHDLAATLVLKDSQATIQQNSFDYRFLYDAFERGDFGGMKALPVEDGLTTWISAFQTADAAETQNQWRQKHTLPWLVAALSRASDVQPGVDELVTAGLRVGPDSPAYATAAFHSIRLLIDSKQTGEARSRLDKLLAAETASLPQSSLNLFRAERMKIAANWDEFLKYSVRIPAGSFTGFEQYGNTGIEGEDASLPEGVKPRQPAFDADAAKILNQQTPLDLLLDAARRDVLPKPMRREVAASAWVRSILLGDENSAKSVAPLLQDLAPDLKAPLRTYLEASDSAARRFAAVYLMLQHPGLRPYVQVGFGRLAPPEKLDEFRDNWWCSFTGGQDAPDYYRVASTLPEPLQLLYPDGAPKAQFLSADQQARGQREWTRLTETPPAPEYLTNQAVEWAKNHPSDPRSPEALHLAVRAVRYGCGAKKGASKEAFQLLHQKYPDSAWARKTKYWY
ncbi:MAG: hypothetical protein LAP39_14580 [Acidobacteriia bacterium]|nr:hypothetical protein [Terriglobia bacterium]